MSLFCRPQFAKALCDDRGVDFSVFQSDEYTFKDIHYGSEVFSRPGGFFTSVLAAARPDIALRAIFVGAPVMKAKVIQLKGGGSILSIAVSHMVLDGKSAMKVGAHVHYGPIVVMQWVSYKLVDGGRWWRCGPRRPGGYKI